MIQTDISELKQTEEWWHYTVYSLVNLDNGKRYIGRTKRPKHRMKLHFNAIKSHRHTNKLIDADSDCRFGYEILEEGIPFDKRTDKERDYIIQYKTYDKDYGYNCNDHYVKTIKKMLEKEKQCQKFT